MQHFIWGCGGRRPKEPSPAREENLYNLDKIDISTIKEILIIFFCGIGDMVVFIPALEALSHFFLRSRISVMTAPPAHELLSHNPHIHQTYLLDAAYRKNFFRRFDFIVNLTGHKDDINHILRHSNVKHLIIRDCLFPGKDPLHASEFHLEFIKDITSRFKRPLVHLTNGDRQPAQRYLRRIHFVPETDLIIAMHAGSSNPDKLWDWRRFRKVCSTLIEDYHAKILLLSGPSEHDVNKKIATNIGIGNRIVVVEEKLRLVAALLERSRLLITNDSGIMHLAAAVGTPIISIFNSSMSSPEMWGPLTDHHVAICKETHAAIRVKDVMRGVKLLLDRTDNDRMTASNL